MNIIRTKAVELTDIPAIAFKQKLASGGAGIKIMRMDQDVTAVFTLDKRTGDAVSYGGVDDSLFPDEAIEEAVTLTAGLPYSARGKVHISMVEQAEQEDIVEEESAPVDMTSTQEYQAFVDRYSDEKGKLNYQLMNKDLIQFAAKSKVVADMTVKNALTDEIVLFIVKSRAAFFANKKESLDDEMTAQLIETLDEIDPRSAFKELKAYINRSLAKSKKR